MTHILLALFASGGISVALCWIATHGFKIRHDIAGAIGVLGCAATVVGFIAYTLLAWEWLAAGEKAQIINAEFGTNYTQQEMFFASDVIEVVRHIERKRYEIDMNTSAE